jgi:alpha-N-arabinofuranosidase
VKLGFEGIDSSLFFDDDGKAWVVNNGSPEGTPLYNGHRAIWIQEYDLAVRKMTGLRKVLVNGGVDISKKPIWIEGPHLYKKDGWYYLCCAEGGTGPQHSQVIFRGKNVDGPFTPWENNPILTQRDLSADKPGAVTCTGHADLVIGPDNNWWAVFLGVRPYQEKFSPMGRETFLLPVKWTDDGWPIILPKGERVPLTMKSPNAVSLQASRIVPFWIMLRTPKTNWWSVDSNAGKLKLIPQAEQLSGRGNPSYLARRIQHARFTASTALAVPGEPGVSAGLAVFQGELFNYFVGVRRETNGVSIFLEQSRGQSQQVIKAVSLKKAVNLKLRVTANDAKCAFEYAADNGPWEVLAADLDATLLTTDVAGGFVGATVGPYVRLDVSPQ